MKSIGSGLVVVGLVGGAGKGAVVGGEGGEVGVLVEGVPKVGTMGSGASPDGEYI